MRKTILALLTLLVLLLIIMAAGSTDFAMEQKRFPRVREAYLNKYDSIQVKLDSLGLSLKGIHILMVAYKAEKVLELYGKKPSESTYKKIRNYRICATSGFLGPKREQGDMQIPEGFYHINHFNPSSTFYLSLKVNYPNAADRIKSKASRLGGDIYIHGSCATIGCLPMTDEKIKELYVYAVQATQSGQAQIPVYIFPFRLNEANFPYFSEQHKSDSAKVQFWANLKQGHDLFYTNFKELPVKVSKNGDYLFP